MGKDNKDSKILSKIGKVIIPVLVMALIIYEARNIFKEINITHVAELMRSTSLSYLMIFFMVAVIAIVSLCAYDFVLMDYYNYKVKLLDILRISWICVSFNNIMGFGGLTGATLRTYLFKKEGIETRDLINYNMILVPSSIIGLSFMTLFSLTNAFGTYTMLNRLKWLWFPVIAFCLFIPIYFVLGNFKWLDEKLKKFNLYFEGSFDIKLKLTVFSILEWISRAMLLYVIARSFNCSSSYLAILGVDLISAAAGLISFIPSGVGSYDIIALMGLGQLGFSGDVGLSIILLFRIFYFIIPWVVGGILWVITLLINVFKKNKAV